MTFEAFLRQVERAYLTTPHYRYGQALYNELTDVNPQMAMEICGTDLDPFYKTGENEFDARLTPTIDYINTHWETNSHATVVEKDPV